MALSRGVTDESLAGDSAEAVLHRRVIRVLSGLLLGMFVSLLTSSGVSVALPGAIAELGGDQTGYAWAVTAPLLTLTISLPLWGKLSDLFNKRVLVQSAYVIFVFGALAAAVAPNVEVLVAARLVEGVGVGGLAALSQVIIAVLVPPRQRGRYSGYFATTFAAATICGPLFGGVVADAALLGWRWCFCLGVPFALLSLVILRRTLVLPRPTGTRRRIDWAGALLFTVAVALLLIWVTLVDDWLSWITVVLLGCSALLSVVFIRVERRALQPVVPLRLFRDKTVTLTVLASLFVGVVQMAAPAFLGQYFQLALGASPTLSGLMTTPTVVGLVVATTVSGLAIAHFGRWKLWLLIGGALMGLGLVFLGAVPSDTEYWRAAVPMALMGLGIGMVMQNLVLAAQNQVEADDLGAVSSLVSFSRSLGGTLGASAMGAVLSARVAHYLGGSGEVPKLERLSEASRGPVEEGYSQAIADMYLWTAPVAFAALLLMMCIKEVPLRKSV
ncbi:MFS transporter [Streptomyces olindensis]|uniref:MFS transporter n=1 Tax=Streptomyces olindensis TaxID=358823 RepID=A0ABV2XSR0_9ACTN